MKYEVTLKPKARSTAAECEVVEVTQKREAIRIAKREVKARVLGAEGAYNHADVHMLYPRSKKRGGITVVRQLIFQAHYDPRSGEVVAEEL
jgi:hypothetical protein